MQITVTARHFDMTNTIRDYAETEVLALKKYFDHIIDVHFILDVNKSRHLAELTLHANNLDLNAKAEADNMYAAIDFAIDKMETQVKKKKEKIKNHKNQTKPASLFGRVNVMPDFEDTAPIIIKSEKFILRNLSIDEALRELKNDEHDFLVFNNLKDEKVNVVYEREDGNYGLIELV